MMQSKWGVSLVGLVWALVVTMLVGCGTTIEAQERRFAKNTDTMEALAAKNPMMRDAVMAKMAGFTAEKDKLVAAGGESAPKELARLNSRVEEYVRKLDPSLAPKKTTTTSKKLNKTGTPPAPGSNSATAPGSKLGGAAAPGTTPAGKLGGGTAPGAVPAGKLGAGAAPGTAPGKLGGGTAPGTAPGGKLGGGTAPGGKLGGGATPAGKLGGGTAPAAPSGKLGQ